MKLGEWPMSPIVMLHGILLSLVTGFTMAATALLGKPWEPSQGWLIYLTAAWSLTFATKRVTHTDLWRKPPAAASTTTSTTTTTKGAEIPPQ